MRNILFFERFHDLVLPDSIYWLVRYLSVSFLSDFASPCLSGSNCADCRSHTIPRRESGLFMAVPFLCEYVGLILPCADQAAQIAVDEHAPGVRTATVALNLRCEHRVGEPDFRFA